MPTRQMTIVKTRGVELNNIYFTSYYLSLYHKNVIFVNQKKK